MEKKFSKKMKESKKETKSNNSTPTPQFPLENNPEDVETYLKNRIKTIINKCIDKVPNETKKNHMLVGEGGKNNIPICFYNPHNYRLYFDFSRENLQNSSYIRTNPKRGMVGFIRFSIINSTEYFFECKDFQIRVKKNQAEILNKKNPRWYSVELSYKGEKQILKIIKQKDQECRNFLRKFIKVFGGYSSFNILNWFSEDKIKEEEVINLLPLRQKFHNKVGKKVYNEKNFEFNDPAYASTFILNRSIERITPEIAQSIDNLYKKINPLKELETNINTINDVFTKENTKLINYLNSNEKNILSEWIFDKFSLKV